MKNIVIFVKKVTKHYDFHPHFISDVICCVECRTLKVEEDEYI